MPVTEQIEETHKAKYAGSNRAGQANLYIENSVVIGRTVDRSDQCCLAYSPPSSSVSDPLNYSRLIMRRVNYGRRLFH